MPIDTLLLLRPNVTCNFSCSSIKHLIEVLSNLMPLTIPPKTSGLISKTSLERVICVEGFLVTYSTSPSCCSEKALIALATPSVDNKSGLSGKNSTTASSLPISSGSDPISGIIFEKSSELIDSLSIRLRSLNWMLITGILNP